MPLTEKRYWALTRFELIMSVLTFLGIVVAVFTGLIFWRQLSEMRTDERAWITISQGPATFPARQDLTSTTPVSSFVTINNGGKTPARGYRAQFVIEYVVNGDKPEFVYDERVRTTDSVGMIAPNSSHQVSVNFNKGKPHNPEVETRFLTDSEYNDLTNGNAYLAVYGRATYGDIFGANHWVQFCSFLAVPRSGSTVIVTAKDCTDYNDTDSE